MIWQLTILVFSVTYVHSSGRRWQYLGNVCIAVSSGQVVVHRKHFISNVSLILATGN